MAPWNKSCYWGTIEAVTGKLGRSLASGGEGIVPTEELPLTIRSALVSVFVL